MVDSAADVEVWREARRILSSLPSVASSFSTCIRALKSSSSAATSGASAQVGPHLVERFLRAPTVQAAFYFVSKTFREREMAAKQEVKPADLVALYNADELASILALLYLYRFLSAGADKEEWERLSVTVQNGSEIGAQMGLRFPSLGFADGLVVTGVRYLSYLLFLKGDLKTYQKYRRAMKQAKKSFDAKAEIENWGCTHAHLAALLLQRVGFGRDYAEGALRAILASPMEKLPPFASRLRIICSWSDALVRGERPPTVAGEDEHFSDDQSVSDFVESVGSIADSGSTYKWLSRSGADLNDSLEPRFVSDLPAEKKSVKSQQASEGASPASAAVADFGVSYDDLPEEIRKHFPPGDFEQLTSEIKNLLDEK